MKKTPHDYRLKVTDHNDFKTYLTRKNGRVCYISGTETPLAIANLVGDSAAGTRFALEDALNGDAAAKSLRGVLASQWENNPTKCPKVEVL